MLVTFGECALRLSPPGSERLETARGLQVQAAGPESNAAIAARRLGTPATWVSRLPDTPLGRRVVEYAAIEPDPPCLESTENVGADD